MQVCLHELKDHEYVLELAGVRRQQDVLDFHNVRVLQLAQQLDLAEYACGILQRSSGEPLADVMRGSRSAQCRQSAGRCFADTDGGPRSAPCCQSPRRCSAGTDASKTEQALCFVLTDTCSNTSLIFLMATRSPVHASEGHATRGGRQKAQDAPVVLSMAEHTTP